MGQVSPGKPGQSEFAVYYSKYVSLVAEKDVVAAIEYQIDDTTSLLEGLSEETGTFRYAEGKWSVKELIGHVIDTERIFAYRALRIARDDRTPIEGFEQDEYIQNADFDNRTIISLCREFEALRRSNILMLNSFSEAEWLRMGTASGNAVSVRALAYIIAGHELHHIKILRERYLV